MAKNFMASKWQIAVPYISKKKFNVNVKQVYIEKKTSLYLLCDDYVLSIADGISVSTFLCTPGA